MGDRDDPSAYRNALSGDAARGRPIRILQIGKHFFPDRGGIETVTRNISETLIAHNIQADVLCTAERSGAYPELDTPYKLIRCPKGMGIGGNKSVSLSFIRQVAKLSRHYDAALVHMPNPVAAAAVTAFWRKPIIQLWHADIPQRLVRTLTGPLDYALTRKSEVVIGPTPIHLEASHRADFIVPKGVVLGFPVPRPAPLATSEPSAIGKRVQAFLNGRKCSLSIGRLVPYKGFDVLIDAAADFGPDLAAVIVGNGPLHQELSDRIAAKGLSDKVMLTGTVNDEELVELLGMAHIGCMPSVTSAEMYGLAQVDVLAFGKPLVSTKIARSGVSFVNKHGTTGLVVEPGDAPALAEALNRLVSDEALHETLSRGAAKSFAEDHDPGPIGRRYATLIRQVVNAAAQPVSASGKPAAVTLG